jgi:hydroxymethylpyrimidine pyrophosphatase-like HAD family hydrolase
MICALDETKIYKTINLAVCDIASTYIDIESSDTAENTLAVANAVQKLQKEIVSDEFKELLLKIIEKQKFKIDFDENKIQEIKEKIENKLRDKGLLPSRQTAPTLVEEASQSRISDSLIV